MSRSFHEQNIEAFIELLKTKRSLFSAQERDSLSKIILTLPDENEKISELLASWYEKREHILDAQLDILNDLITSEINAKKTIASAIVNAQKAEDQDHKQELIDAIKIITRSKNKSL
jgi:hypothetical protein